MASAPWRARRGERTSARWVPPLMVHGGAWHYAPRCGESHRKNGRGWLPAGFCPLSLSALVEAVETAFEEDEPDGLGPSEVESPSVIAIIEATMGETHVVDEVSPAEKPA